MLVRFLGVALVLAEGLTVADLFAELKKTDGKEFPHRGASRLMQTDKVGAYHVAVIVSVKDHQTMMRLRRDGLNWTVKPDAKQPGADLVDFNFMALHEATGRGLYQHYRGSLSTPFLSNILARAQVRLVNERRDEWVAANSATGAISTVQKKSRKVHPGDENVPRRLLSEPLEAPWHQLRRPETAAVLRHADQRHRVLAPRAWGSQGAVRAQPAP